MLGYVNIVKYNQANIVDYLWQNKRDWFADWGRF